VGQLSTKLLTLPGGGSAQRNPQPHVFIIRERGLSENENEILLHHPCRYRATDYKEVKGVGGRETTTRITLLREEIPAPSVTFAGWWAIQTGTWTKQTTRGYEDQ